ncbi:D-alanine--D-alanine ligase domain-containing protein [Calothrix sp. NIES-2100]|nr:D-alanine--D-alanine ligase domain-containing protein [Calothrix sp. NIES-2100]
MSHEIYNIKNAPKSVIYCMAKAAGITLNELLMIAINETLGNNQKAL